MTPQEREVMKMALDALELVDGYVMGKHEAKEALYEALAQPEQEKTRSQKMREAGYTKRDTRLECDGCGKKFSRLMLPIHDCESAQPEQEPVAWMDAHDPTDLYYRKPLHPDAIPLYTAQPQRGWKGLTDEEIEALWDHELHVHGIGITALRAITSAIEAAVKEINHGAV